MLEAIDHGQKTYCMMHSLYLEARVMHWLAGTSVCIFSRVRPTPLPYSDAQRLPHDVFEDMAQIEITPRTSLSMP
jgi:hypothetical protein